MNMPKALFIVFLYALMIGLMIFSITKDISKFKPGLENHIKQQQQFLSKRG